MKYLIQAEFLKFFCDVKRYAFNYAVGIVSTFLFLSGIFWAVSNNAGGSKAATFMGLILWLFASRSIEDASNHLFEERYYGTFEQLSIAKFPILQIFMVRFLVVFVFSLIQILLVGLPIFLLFSPDIMIFFSTFWNSVIVIAVIITIIVTLYSFGLLLAALSLVYKRVGTLAYVLEYLILFFQG